MRNIIYLKRKCKTMSKSILAECPEIPVTEIRKQLEYARVVCEDLFNQFSVKEAKCAFRKMELYTTQTKLSMLIDFISDASCWCNMLEMNQKITERLEEEEK